MEKFKFYKYSGHGNDFVIIDNWSNVVPEADLAKISKRMCRPKFGVGADGAVFIAAGPDDVDFAVRFFNSDGSEADMCGNASRCAAHLAHLVSIAPATMTFKTKAGTVEAAVSEVVKLKAGKPEVSVAETTVSVQLPKIGRPEGAALVEADGFSQTYYRINTGVPHAVSFAEDLDEINVPKIGRLVRRHASFQPDGTNVDFVKILGDDSISVRTYERGVEDETLACGTGVTASALLAASQKLVSSSSILCKTRGGEDLTVRYEGPPDAPTKVFLEGPVRYVFSGQVEADMFRK
ncbi:MAG: diaminopimelate epimerase [Deltaproteobacteria bacterium]|jgi:diaminopimelate epimerase|nr:diaminopimelate epimerase [Deltaproteobacteria bacterium]